MRLAIVAGEPSGDVLGARVVRQLQHELGEQLEVEGVGGKHLVAAGCHSLFPMERLSVMGIVDPLKRLPELLRIRRELQAHFTRSPPDVFLGVDSPDFNLGLARRLRGRHIPTAHLVSPSVWAWRSGRIETIRSAVDHVFCLFPFEADVYREAGVSHEVVGHPLADDAEDAPSTAAARRALGLGESGTVLALLPGSRVGEVRRHASLFLETARRVGERMPDTTFVVPQANAACGQEMQRALDARAVPVRLVSDPAHRVLAAADGALVASGTATLEAALARRPMVVAYRTGRVTFAILSRLVRTPHVALPNLLSRRRLVPEFLQDEATPPVLAEALVHAVLDREGRAQLLDAYDAIHRSLRLDCAARVATGLRQLASGNRL